MHYKSFTSDKVVIFKAFGNSKGLFRISWNFIDNKVDFRIKELISVCINILSGNPKRLCQELNR